MNHWGMGISDEEFDNNMGKIAKKTLIFKSEFYKKWSSVYYDPTYIKI